MTRPFAQSHLSQLAELLSWMDQEPQRKTLAPEARTPEGLWWEVLAGEGEKAWVWLENGRVEGFVSLVEFWDGAALEGPLVRGGDGQRLLEHAVKKARAEGYPTLYAFPERSNLEVCRLLERAGFSPEHITYFYAMPRRDLSYPVPEGFRVGLSEPCDAEVYRDLYARIEDGWSIRLHWTDEELRQHFIGSDVELFLAYWGEVPVGLAELELMDGEAEIAYIGVLPEFRGKGLGRALLGAAAARAFAEPQVEWLRVRAHDHEKSAQELYRRLGFEEQEAIVTYALEL
ncbi:GNAT family N-acetyltransferase [Meiothermus granaticius]|uniref:Acetyltransferase n=1 Tax=Meiothermus granaticius NBRC 107808 TaxID=1227551 RepID=A0A399FEB1_9DEIN|nr:GNAT family N-acetyltransferase [Meiothermus granaticius]MCL6526312.1 GNAT family N-acetyltransferase [Thermaceae bacterium]RIH93412.1 Acetyltransferase [Meiothermus granaticius NBRC 107808]GEM87661.1 acetyltransferase [Meiothermus granaticius NBRC 107808]